MPMIDLTYPQNALTQQGLAEAVDKLTAALLRWEGAPDTARTRAITWTFLHELQGDAVNVGGRRAEEPIYRVVLTTPEGTLLNGPHPGAIQRRKNLVREVTEIILEAEGTDYDATAAMRVICLIQQIRDGYWGGRGTIFRFKDVVAYARGHDGDPEDLPEPAPTDQPPIAGRA